jgi:cysteine synthase A
MFRRNGAEVYQHPVFQALDPRGAQFLSASRLPPGLNRISDDVEIVALSPRLPHIKTVPAWQMLLEDFENHVLADVHTIVVPSSGNTVHGVALLAPAYGLKVKAVMSTDVPSSKIDVLRAFGNTVDVMQVSNAAEAALEEAEKPGHYHLDQYSHPGNVRAHQLYTGPEIVRALGGTPPAVIAIAMGSAGTLTGVAEYFQSQGTEILVVGVRPKLGQQVPGARDKKKMEEVVRFAWQDRTSAVVEVTRHESFVRTRELWSAVQPQPGPTSGMAWGGLRRYLMDQWEEVQHRVRGRTVAFLCPDDGRFYTAPLLAELDPDEGVESQ